MDLLTFSKRSSILDCAGRSKKSEPSHREEAEGLFSRKWLSNQPPAEKTAPADTFKSDEVSPDRQYIIRRISEMELRRADGFENLIMTG